MEKSRDTDELVRRAAGGDQEATSELVSMYRDRLSRMVQLRLDRRLYGRVDASDIVQEATLEAARRLGEYGRDGMARHGHVTQPRMPQILNLTLLAPDIQEELLFLPRVTAGKPTTHEKMLRPITTRG